MIVETGSQEAGGDQESGFRGQEAGVGQDRNAELSLVRRCPKRGYALKGVYILAQGNALGNTETNTSALSRACETAEGNGRDIGYTLMCGQYIPPFQGFSDRM
jgi:hypothetical protein